MQEEEATKKMFSFNFAKKKDNRKLQDSQLRDESTKDEEDDKDFVFSVQGTQIHGTKKKEEKKVLVIPLIEKNEWRGPHNISNLMKSSVRSASSQRENQRPNSSINENNQVEELTSAEKTSNPEVIGNEPSSTQKGGTADLDELAIQEILRESKDTANGFSKEDGQIPLLLQNQIPEGFEEEDNMDVSLRPDQSTMEDYDRIPIEEFGMAMLRGMGWSKAEGIGLRNKQHVEMLEPQLRAKGLGLGAERPKNPKDVVPNTNSKEKEEELKFKIGAAAVINKGANKGMYGRVEGFDEDNNRVILKLAINKTMAAISKFHMTLVSEKEFDKKSKVLNNEQYDEFKKKHDEKDRKHKDAESRKREQKHSDRKRQKDDSGRRSRDEPTEKRSKKDYEDHVSSRNQSSKKPTSSASDSSAASCWVRPHLRVRFIDRKYKHGKYYEKKFVVEDVVQENNFVLRSDSGDTFLEDITSAQVETVIPKEPRTPICILTGKRRGRVGELVEKNRKKQTAVVKLPDGYVLELSYDDICEFVGDPEDYY